MRRTRIETFGLSFIDAVLCGFGAVVLLFLILAHDSLAQRREATEALRGQLRALEGEVLRGRREARSLDQALSGSRAEHERLLARAQTLDGGLAGQREALAALGEDNQARRRSLERLMAELKSREEGLGRLEGGGRETPVEGDRLRAFPGEGDRQYLTGLKIGGRHVVILLDASASMLAERIVDVIRLRNLPAARQEQAAKWRRARDTLEWLVARLPPEARFQVLLFNETAGPAVAGTGSRWLDAGAPDDLDRAVEAVRSTLPAGGTSLHNAFEALADLDPAPDNVLLITDGLPTLHRERGTAETVTPRQRLRLFERSLKALPPGVPVNVILLPMEGDPMAAPAYWRLAQTSRGSFMSPSQDWP